MKKGILVLIIVVLAFLVLGGVFYYKNLRGIGPAVKPPAEDVAELIPQGNSPFSLPPGFSAEVFAKDLPGARVMAQDSFGNFWVSQPSQGTVSLLEIERGTGKVRNQGAVFRDLNNPHGLAFDPQNDFLLYIAEEDKISRVGVYSEDALHKIADLPSGSGHFTRTIAFGPDGRLYVSIGSSCNVCNEKDERRAKILSMNPDGSDVREFASGLRNTVFFDWSYVDGRMWGTDMGRDFLGDDLPPDEINIIEEGKDYGWPTCYGKNIHDSNFDKNVYVRDPCADKIPSYVDIPAHSAPLGLAFIPEEGWPEDYWYDLIVAYHGSWNRSEPTGYKLVRVRLDAQGNYEGTEDFMTGFLKDGSAIGRPVQVIARPGGLMYATDDKAGVIYKITYFPFP